MNEKTTTKSVYPKFPGYMNIRDTLCYMNKLEKRTEGFPEIKVPKVIECINLENPNMETASDTVIKGMLRLTENCIKDLLEGIYDYSKITDENSEHVRQELLDKGYMLARFDYAGDMRTGAMLLKKNESGGWDFVKGFEARTRFECTDTGMKASIGHMGLSPERAAPIIEKVFHLNNKTN